ncbi:uncharacterized protein LOC134184800 [Corticium candelabrum]|uniref:uncharacterized protein LOC134184800 n=1 Tax=Corticium candelabrum TaxID=121492 RepID=UPI002E2F27C5|nr:uncharacterized protein LOC134184800 [Corticium candelabrum]
MGNNTKTDEQQTHGSGTSQRLSGTPWLRWRRPVILISIAVIVGLGLFSLGLVPWCVVKSKSRKTLTTNQIFTTRAISISGILYDKVNISVTSQVEMFHRISLHVYSKPPPLDVYRHVDLRAKYFYISPGIVFPREFFLNIGSVVNLTFCADGQTRLLVIKGEGTISDFDNIRSPFQLVHNEVCGPAACRSESDVCKMSFASIESDLYHFCFETDGVDSVNVTRIVYSINSLQYNLNATEGKSCVPLNINEEDGNAWCDLPVPWTDSAVAIVEMAGIAHQNLIFVIKTYVRQSFIWIFAGIAICLVGITCTVMIIIIVARSSRSRVRQGCNAGSVQQREETDPLVTQDQGQNDGNSSTDSLE